MGWPSVAARQRRTELRVRAEGIVARLVRGAFGGRGRLVPLAVSGFGAVLTESRASDADQP
jgi:hypothetical protein